MKNRAQATLLPDGRRLHLHDGPIDLIIEAFGTESEIKKAYRVAAERFESVLDELCRELPLLRQSATENGPRPVGVIAMRMYDAVLPYCQQTFVTPMAAVAGSVAEEILRSMMSVATLSRAYVNNGGDIALHLSTGESFIVGMVERPDEPSLFGTLRLDAAHAVRGIATSGWRGRSFSLGIADAVTVLADRASAADAAATIIANNVDLPGHPSIVRIPACELDPDSDLGDRLVTRQVGELSDGEISDALRAGAVIARSILSDGLIRAAALRLHGSTSVIREATPSGIALDADPIQSSEVLIHA